LEEHDMANLTISLDDDLLRRARVRAARLGTSVNAVLRDYVRMWAGGHSARARAVSALLTQAAASKGARAGRDWTREDLHDR